MNRQEKQKIIDAFKSDFQQSQASFVVSMQGMTVEAVQKLRRELFGQSGSIKVAKNTLLKRATSDLPGINDLAPYFKDQIAIVFAHKDAPAVAKVLYTVAKEQEKLKLQAGALDTRFIAAEQIEFLATLPSREVLLAKLCGTLQAPIAQYVSLLNQMIVRLLWVMKEIEKKKVG
jgi:large subunit ribosomal protein L10